MAKYQNDKLYQKVNNKPKKFGNNNVNSINVIVNPKDEPEHQRMPNPIVNNLMDIVPPTNADIQQIASRAAQDGRTINAEEVRDAGMQTEIGEAMQQNAEQINFQERYEEMEQHNERLTELVGRMENMFTDTLEEEVRIRLNQALEQQEGRELEPMREVEQQETINEVLNKADDIGDAGVIPSPPKKEIYAKLQQIDSQWERLWNSIKKGEDVSDSVDALIQEDTRLKKESENYGEKAGIDTVRNDNQFRKKVIKWYNEVKKLN